METPPLHHVVLHVKGSAIVGGSRAQHLAELRRVLRLYLAMPDEALMQRARVERWPNPPVVQVLSAGSKLQMAKLASKQAQAWAELPES